LSRASIFRSGEGLVTLAEVAVDGTKIRASASKASFNSVTASHPKYNSLTRSCAGIAKFPTLFEFAALRAVLIFLAYV
jgi:hypothetical protein